MTVLLLEKQAVEQSQEELAKFVNSKLLRTGLQDTAESFEHKRQRANLLRTHEEELDQREAALRSSEVRLDLRLGELDLRQGELDAQQLKVQSGEAALQLFCRHACCVEQQRVLTCCSCLWAACYTTSLLVKIMLEVVVFSFVFLLMTLTIMLRLTSDRKIFNALHAGLKLQSPPGINKPASS